ncbi:hypothetical protein ACS0TY_024059 [Phlomoides rotata]
MNAVNSRYFKQMISRVASMDHGYTDLTILSLRSKWAETGCIMGDGWTDRSHRSLINFLVYCPYSISFMKSCDMSDILSSAENLCNLFSSIVNMVGEKNVIHMVTDNASNYKTAGKLLHAKYPGIYWSPCSAHCINLTLEDVGKMDLVQECVVLGSRITKFVYNHKWPLAWLRQMDATRFSTNFITLKSLYDHKEHLEAMVICPDYKKFLKTEKGRGVKDTVWNHMFWNNCLIIVKIMEPLIRLLCICDTDEKPSLDYVYDGLSRAIRGTNEIFNNQESKYKPIVDIINKI